MANRLDLHEKLCELLGSRNVYFLPPASTKMRYPAIRYSLKNIENRFANDHVYGQKTCYEVILITDDPDSELINQLSVWPLCRFDRPYVADNLNHYVFTLYF